MTAVISGPTEGISVSREMLYAGSSIAGLLFMGSMNHGHIITGEIYCLCFHTFRGASCCSHVIRLQDACEALGNNKTPSYAYEF